MDLGIFYAKTCKEDPYQFSMFVIPRRTFCQVSSPDIEPSEDFGVKEDELIYMIESVEALGIGD